MKNNDFPTNLKANRSKMAEFFNVIKVPLIVFLVTVFVYKCILFSGYVPSVSMDPTLQPGSRIFGERVSVLFDQEVKRGEVLVFKHDLNGKSTHLVKRVIGLPGDKVELKRGRVYINDEILDEPYVSSWDAKQEDTVVTVPKDSYFMCGDNRANSFDSRYWENMFVKENDIVARLWFTYSIFTTSPHIHKVK